MNIVRVFDSNVTKTPDKPFLRFPGSRPHVWFQVQDGSRRAAAPCCGRWASSRATASR